MAWVETNSPSFQARHSSDDAEAAAGLLRRLERFRSSLEGRFETMPEEVAVVIHTSWVQLAVAHPWLELARFMAAPASRRYFGGWFTRHEIHVLSPALLEERASAVPGSAEALRLSPLHEYAHLVIGANNRRLPPPFTPRTFREYLRWAWLCEGAATYLSGQTPHLAAAITRRLREGPPPVLPPSTRDAMLLGGSVFDLLERERGPEACVALASKLVPAGPEAAIERAFGIPVPTVARHWRDYLSELTSREATTTLEEELAAAQVPPRTRERPARPAQG